MRTSDPILEELWRARDQHARRFQYDLKKICADLRRIEEASGYKVVRLPPKRLKKTKTPPAKGPE
jgi:hypothetical protein